MHKRRNPLRCTAGWRHPEGVFVVARPIKWCDPFRVDGFCLNRLPQIIPAMIRATGESTGPAKPSRCGCVSSTTDPSMLETLDVKSVQSQALIDGSASAAVPVAQQHVQRYKRIKRVAADYLVRVEGRRQLSEMTA